MPNRIRCPWCRRSAIEQRYHDEEWGRPRYDDAGQFEFLTLEAAQAGLSWLTVLNKREGYRAAFAGFDPEKVARFTQQDIERLVLNPGIIRNRKKIESAVSNARCFLDLAAKHGSFSAWIWSFVDGRPLVNAWADMAQVPATTALSDALAKEFKRLGFRFLGSTVVYAHMQATGLVNDHIVTCFRHGELALAAEGSAAF